MTFSQTTERKYLSTSSTLNCRWFLRPPYSAEADVLFCLNEPATFCFLRALSAPLWMSAWMWDLCCFLIAILSFSRLRGLSKEGRGYPRRSCVGIAACWGNPGQEGRNQGRRANERVSGETLVSFFHLSFTLSLCLFLSSLFFCMSCSCFLLMSGSFLSMCLCFFVCLCLSWSVCFGGDAGSRRFDNSLLAHRVCVCVCVCEIVCVCVQCSQCFWTNFRHIKIRGRSIYCTALFFVTLHTVCCTQ